MSRAALLMSCGRSQLPSVSPPVILQNLETPNVRVFLFPCGCVTCVRLNIGHIPRKLKLFALFLIITQLQSFHHIYMQSVELDLLFKW